MILWSRTHTYTPDHRYTNTHRENQSITRSRAKESEPHPHTAARRRLTLTANSLWNTLTHQHTNFEATTTTTSRAVKCVFYVAGKKRTSFVFASVWHTCLCVSSVFDHSLTHSHRRKRWESEQERIERKFSLVDEVQVLQLAHTSHTHTDTDTNQQKQCNFSVFFSVCLDFSFWF